MPAFLPVSRGGEGGNGLPSGVKADPVIISTFLGSPALSAGSFTSSAEEKIDIV